MAPPTGPERSTPTQKLALTRKEAAERLSMSIDTFKVYVQPNLRTVRVGRRVLVPTSELTRWLERNQAMWGER